MTKPAQVQAPADFKQYQGRKHMIEDKPAVNDNFTMVPNAFLDKQLAEIKSFPELKIVLAVIRKTIGFNKKQDIISFSQFEKLTGLTRPSVNDGINSALKNGFIFREKSGQSWSYRLEVVASGYQYTQATSDESSSPRLPVVVAPGYQLSQKVVAPGYPQKKEYLNKDLNKEREGTTDVVPAPRAAGDSENDLQFQVVRLIASPASSEKSPKPSSRQSEVTLTDTSYPAPSSSPSFTYPVKKIKRAVGAGGRDMNTKTEPEPEKPKPAKPEKPKDERLTHPAVIAYQNKFNLTPDDNQRDLITTQVTDLGQWGKTLAYWKDNKYRPLSVGKILDCYSKKGYERNGNGNSNANGPLAGTTGAANGDDGSAGHASTGNRRAYPARANGTGKGASFDPGSFAGRTEEEIEREFREFRLTT